MKRMIRAAAQSLKWQDEIFDGVHYYELETSKGKGTVSSFENDGDWGYNVRIDVNDVPSAGGIRKTFRGRDSKAKAMEYVENVLCGTKVTAAYEDDDENDLGEACINAWEYALDQAGLQEEDVHVLTYEEVKTFEKILARELSNRHVSLPQQSAVIPQEGRGSVIEGLKIGGNTDAIANNLIREVTKKAWRLVPKEENIETIEYADDSGMEIYTQDKYGYCVRSNAQKALQLVGAGDKTQYAGHGSQGYIDDTKVAVFEDYFGNVKVARTTVRYD